jgi:hypothetical protein
MNYKLGRNEKCQCGSGKKYKKCCFNNQTNQIQIKKKFESLNFKDHRNYNPKKNSELRYVVNFKNLPTEITSEIRDYTKIEKIVRGCCWYNSSHLSLINEDIEVVHGYYGEKLTDYEINSIQRKVNQNILSPNKDGWYPFTDEYGKGFYDLKNKTMLSPHSWNIYSDENGKEIHFDITKEYDLNLQKNWVYYYPIKTEGTSSLNMNTKRELIKIIKERKNYSPQIQLNK